MRFAAVAGKHPRILFLAFGSGILGVALDAVGPLLVKSAVDETVAGDTGQLGWLTGALVVLAAIRFGSAFARRYYGGKIAVEMQHDLRGELFRSIQKLDGDRQDELRTGQVMSRASTDLRMLQGLPAMLPLVVGTVVMLAVASVSMLLLSVPLALVVLAITGTALVFGVRSQSEVRPATKAVQQQAADLVQHLEETVTGIRAVRGFGQEQRELSRVEKLAARLFTYRIRAALVARRSAAALATLPVLGQLLVVAVGGWLALRGNLSIGTLVAFSAYMATLTGVVKMLGGVFFVAKQTRVAFERVCEVIDTESRIADTPDAVNLPAGGLEVRLEQVGFGYGDAKPVLDDVSLTVRHGETLALVGTVGSGKSSIAQLLPRFYDPRSGSVRIGTPDALLDIRTVRLESLRQAVGVVFEDSFLFSGTIRANIVHGRPDATDAEVEAAARIAAAHEFIKELPDGYDTAVGERGLTLSGGQRQRIALAGVLLADPRMLVLDDVTSAVDTSTEAALHTTLGTAVEGRTTILIARRRTTLALADRIAVLDGGRVVDIGTEAELAGRCELFQRLLASPGEDIEVPATELGETNDEGWTSGLWPHPRDTAADDAPAATEKPLAEAPDDGKFRLRALLRPVRVMLLMAGLAVTVDVLSSIALPTLIRHAIDDGVLAGASGPLWTIAGIGVVVVLAKWVAVRAEALWAARAGENVLYRLRLRCYAALHRLGLDFFEREKTGRILTTLTSDIDALSKFVQAGVTTVALSLLSAVGIIIALLVVDPLLSAVALAVLPLVLLATAVFRRVTVPIYKRAREQISEINSDIQEQVSGLRTTQARRGEGRFAKAFGRSAGDYRESRLRTQKAISIYFPLLEFFSDVAYAAVLAVGAYRIADGTLTTGALAAFLLYLGLLLAPVQQISTMYDLYQEARVGLARIGKLLGEPTSVPPRADPVPVPARLRGEVEFRDVEFHYPGRPEPALTGVCFTIEPGRTAAIVGATGAGKSTVVKLMARFHDVGSGRVLVDGTDVRDYDQAEYRSRIAVLAQESHLFSGTVAQNVAYGRPDATRAEVERATREAGAFDMIAALPGGFGHEVGEHGKRLSAGQRQLIGLARAFLADPDVLLLDETTSMLDPESEGHVLSAVRGLARDRTTVIVTHRLAVAAGADVVLVLSDGRLVERGHHDELMAEGGVYADLWADATRRPPSAEVGAGVI